MNRVITFFKEVRIELAKVSWPTRRQLWRYTLAVVLISLAVAIFMGIFDFIFTGALQKFLFN